MDLSQIETCDRLGIEVRDATVDEAVHDVSVVEKSLLVLGDALGIDAVTSAERLVKCWSD